MVSRVFPYVVAAGVAAAYLTVTLQPAVAADDAVSQVERLHAEGSALYRSGSYHAAVEKFREAYAIYPDPTILYNIGRAYEALGQVETAMKMYERCASDAKVTAATKRRAEAKLEMLRRAQRLGTTAPRDTSSGTQKATGAGGQAAQGTVRSRSMTRTAAWIAGGVALALAAGMGTMMGLTKVADSDLDDELHKYPGSKDSLDSARSKVRAFALAADILLGATVAAAGITTYLFLTSRSQESAERSAGRSVHLGLAPGGAVIQGRF